jgi:nucleotide-binding universal stress UspA family protein
LDNESLHDKAIPIAAYLAKKCGAQLHLLCVIPTLGTLAGEQAASGSLLPSTTTAFLDMAEEIAIEHFQAHLDEFQKSGIASSAEIARGDPAAIIAKTADNITANLIIFGTHGRAGLDAFWNRSVAASVARRTQTPLLLIPLVD